ncbi:PREDICTED: major histocompatibility complex class I-related gene protein-like isoform X2 [Cyprinodon variegatus]|uniref:major histocompatibility complex class I-related gene protein-like isoform X2 n=1 Tax=Cyprinodon variegatus TaxID=28743 RepID=UPI000742C7B4|nr:PREDICTED: major histocompatibility complex class I-related gene protein-like isoform X2 [Cyprinodon variegatus]
MTKWIASKIMKELALLIVFWRAVAPEKHYLSLHHFLYPGVPDFPVHGVTGVVEGIIAFYSYEDVVRIRHDWVNKLIKENNQLWEAYYRECLNYRKTFRAETADFNDQTSSENEIIQLIVGCELDEETNTSVGYALYGNNGEDYIEIDLKRDTWIATNPKAAAITKKWNENKSRNVFWKTMLQEDCPNFLKLFWRYGQPYITRKVLPSVFLLQKNSSSPVTCLSTGFFPENSNMFWRKDGEEIHEGVKHGDILPNGDGSFQMSVDLQVLSIPHEDWERYECVFKLSGVQNYVVTKLVKETIRSNVIEDEGIAVIAAMAGVIIIIIVGFGFFATKSRKTTDSISTSENDPAIQ